MKPEDRFHAHRPRPGDIIIYKGQIAGTATTSWDACRYCAG